jgi:hypothetical protein
MEQEREDFLLLLFPSDLVLGPPHCPCLPPALVPCSFPAEGEGKKDGGGGKFAGVVLDRNEIGPQCSHKVPPSQKRLEKATAKALQKVGQRTP